MTLDPRARRLLDMLALSPAPPGRLSTEARRESFAKLMDMGARPIQIAHYEDITIQGPGGALRLRLYDARPGTGRERAALVFFHGGGLVAGSIDTHDAICRALARASGAMVFSVGYRRAPESRFPAALTDAAFACSWLAGQAKGHGIDQTRIAVGGESAGALLATLICNGYHAANLQPKAQLLLCPVIDLHGSSPSRAEYGRGHLIDAGTIARDIEDCIGEEGDPATLPSPLRNGNAGKSPPTIIVSAECDPFRDEAGLYGAMLDASGVSVQHTCYPGMIHSFYGLTALLPQADKALDWAGEQLAHVLAAQPS